MCVCVCVCVCVSISIFTGSKKTNFSDKSRNGEDEKKVNDNNDIERTGSLSEEDVADGLYSPN